MQVLHNGRVKLVPVDAKLVLGQFNHRVNQLHIAVPEVADAAMTPSAAKMLSESGVL